jgi:hypothetical protein
VAVAGVPVYVVTWDDDPDGGAFYTSEHRGEALAAYRAALAGVCPT